MEIIIKLKGIIQKDGQRHLYVKSAITSGTTQYKDTVSLTYYNQAKNKEDAF